jgi:hypothetical protein
MSIYKMGVQGVDKERDKARPGSFVSGTTFIPPRSVMANPAHDSESFFWVFVKWLGAGLTLYVGYEKATELYRKHMRSYDDDGSEDPAAEDQE